MPFQMRFRTDTPPRCRFAVSPLWEVQEAVRTLRRPDRQSRHLPWLRRVRDAAAGLDLTPLWLLMPAGGRGPDFLCPYPPGPYTGIGEELERLRATDPAVARGGLERSLAGTPGAAASGRGRAMLDDPARAVKELADLLELAWKALLAPDWPRLHALLTADIAFHTRRLAEGGPERLFAELHPRLSWSDGTLTIDHPGAAGTGGPTPAGSGLLLVPGVFCWPDVMGGFDAPWQPALAYPARGIGGLWSRPGEQVPEPLARLLGRGRAAVLTAVVEPATTTGLALRLGLAPSSVSAHLSALRDAGLLTSRRCGHEVLYERTPLGLALAAG